MNKYHRCGYYYYDETLLLSSSVVSHYVTTHYTLHQTMRDEGWGMNNIQYSNMTDKEVIVDNNTSADIFGDNNDNMMKSIIYHIIIVEVIS